MELSLMGLITLILLDLYFRYVKINYNTPSGDDLLHAWIRLETFRKKNK